MIMTTRVFTYASSSITAVRVGQRAAIARLLTPLLKTICCIAVRTHNLWTQGRPVLLRGFAQHQHLVAVVTLMTSVAGCHRPLRPVFEQTSPPITWPSDPTKARFRYVGCLKSSADLKPHGKPLQGLVDLFVGRKPAQSLYGPRSLIVTGGGERLWVADPGGRCVHIFDLESRSYRRIIDAGRERLLSPSGLCTASDRAVFVCDSEASAIHEYDDDSGVWRRSLRLTDDIKRPVAVRYNADRQELFVVDVAAHDIKVLSREGRLIRVIGRRGSKPGEFNFPCDIADDGTLIWVADTCNQRIQGLTYLGEPVVTFGEAGDAPGKMALPKGVAVDSQGNVYVVDARFENVQIFDRMGNLLLVIGKEGIGFGQFSLPSGIFIDISDRVWICDTYNKRIQVLNPIRGATAGD